ncbi:SDR family oxidoreductase [Flavivirga amylovorans]|uniref:SDR family oxidoreductase n=1 Tax=Flavivirga amylovorans TaxID=870486 RepID=A0ABT8X0Y7_9FLAO|nr:SDR family oxidoreductase [Flavivirga amylovorans]MDO5987601.1 SDR family oxidoreductase [Flavivirga amylovorans]
MDTITTSERKSALITGACGDIGSRVSKDLAEKGYHLILADINQEANEALVESLPSAEAVTIDLTNRDALSKFCEKMPEYNPHIVFINAGMVHPGEVVDISERMVDLQLEINLRSAIILNRAAGIHMKIKGEGHIVNTVSIGGVFGLKSSSIYSAAKFGLRGFLMAFHSEMKSFGVHVAGIYSAAVDTQMLRYEANNGGSVLNFVCTPTTVEHILKGFNKAIEKKKLEVYVPYSDSIFPRLLGGVMPGLIDRFYPMLERMGKKGRKKYLDRLAAKGL